MTTLRRTSETVYQNQGPSSGMFRHRFGKPFTPRKFESYVLVLTIRTVDPHPDVRILLKSFRTRGDPKVSEVGVRGRVHFSEKETTVHVLRTTKTPYAHLLKNKTVE